MLDLRTLTDDATDHGRTVIFNEMRDKELKPAYLADADPNRALLDRRVICDLLGFDRDTYAAVRKPRRQVVRGAVGARRQGTAKRVGVGGVGGVLPSFPPPSGNPGAAGRWDSRPRILSQPRAIG